MKVLWAGVVAVVFSSFTTIRTIEPNNAAVSLADSARFDMLYDNLDLQGLELSREAYHKAVLGFLALQMTGAVHNPDVLSIVDFSLPSTQKRLFIIDMQNGRLLFNTFVAHGRNSGQLMATRFSNRTNSYMSSLGFYLTGDPFVGQHGYSLRLQGIERGWNDHAPGGSLCIRQIMSARNISSAGDPWVAAKDVLPFPRSLIWLLSMR